MESHQIPPDCLQKHCQLVNFQAFIMKHSLVSILEIPPPDMCKLTTCDNQVAGDTDGSDHED